MQRELLHVPEKGNKEWSFNKLASINDVNEFIRRIIYSVGHELNAYRAHSGVHRVERRTIGVVRGGSN